MRLSGIDVEPLNPQGAARVIEFVPSSWVATPDERELTFDEGNHLSGARRGGWLAAVFRINAPQQLDAQWDEHALARAVDAFVARHPTLHRLPSLAGSSRMTTLPRHAPRALDDASPQALEVLLDDACAPAPDDDGVPLGPAYRVLALVPAASGDAAGGVTVVAAFDHVHVDAWSIQLIVRDLESLYLAEVQANQATNPGADGGLGRSIGPDRRGTASAAAPPETAVTATRRTVEPAVLPPPNKDDRAGTAHWYAFLEDGGLPTPPFPLDSATAPDGSAEGADKSADEPTAPGLMTRTASLPLGADDGRGGSLLPTTLLALGRAVHAVSGEQRLRALLPVHTRRAPGSDELLGWHVTNTPLAFDVEATSDDVRAAVRAAVACAPVDLAAMLTTYPGGVRLGPLFTVSFLDYRQVPGHEAARRTGAVQLSGRGQGSGLQLWFARTDNALHLRCRHPATAVADRHVTALLAHLEDELAAASHDR